ncbi:MAG: hypothetical protein DMF85_10345 [Acidobacteria bacterium]|nr:MAG: hypothetical protein DMF85_10345 [Acidobacteriota bacterium]
MLRFLSISRLAVIDRLELEFAPGLNVLTGETGAGKSILVGAVGLLVGGRASADLVRTGEETAAVQAIFETPSWTARSSPAPRCATPLARWSICTDSTSTSSCSIHPPTSTSSTNSPP